MSRPSSRAASLTSWTTSSGAVTLRPPTRPSTRLSTTTASERRPQNAPSRTTALSVLGLTETQSVVCAISEGRGVSPTIGLALVNISVGEAILCQICDNQSYVKTIHKLQMASPSRIVFTATVCPPNRPSTLYSLVRDLLPESQLVSFDRSAWNETAGLDYIQQFTFEDDVEPIKVAIQGKFYATASFAASLKYIQQVFALDFVQHSLRIRYQPSDDTMMIDISALQCLEIMQNQSDHKSKDCLYGLLNHTLTPMGSRMLRSNVLQPPTRYNSFIQPRYQALDELTCNEEMFRSLRNALKGFFDVEKLLTKLIIIPKISDIRQVEERLNNVLMIKGFLESIPGLWRALGKAQSALLIKIRNLCDPKITNPILALICNVIEPDVAYMKSPLDLRNQRTFAVRPGIRGLLDVARQTYKELTEEIHEHVAALNERYGIGAALKFDNGRKYWLLIKDLDYDQGGAQSILINVVRKKGNIECQTLDLMKLNLRLSDTSNEVVIQSDLVIHDLVESLRREASHLFRVCESVALVDMISAFAQLTTTRDYVQPEITGTLALKMARHPLLEKILPNGYVPNDYYSTDQYCFHIVTGANMSGKSTYIRTVALLQIMAQVGCFVPAEYASFSIVHNIFARLSMNDNIEANLSTFSVEMREMAFILRHADGQSLAIIDELGRGTGTADGLAIAIAMSEALIESKASVWFATHFLDLARVLSDRPGVLNLHLQTHNSLRQDGKPLITMLYKVASGSIDNADHYGINLARAMGLPQSLTDMAEEVARDLRAKREASRQNSEARRVMERRKLILNLHEALIQASRHGSDETLPGYLHRLQEEFTERMAELADP